MPAIYTDVQDELAALGASMAADGLVAARSVLDGGDIGAEPTASLLSGFSGLGVPESAGGAGGTLTDLCILVEQLGRELVPTSFTAHAAAVQAAHAAGLDVGAAASGEQRWTFGLASADGAGWANWSGPDASPLGARVAVPHVADADALVTPCGDDVLTLVDGPFEARRREGIDPAVRLADVDLSASNTLRAQAEGASAALLRGALVVAAELSGIGQGALRLAAAYASEREQFGTAIGKFQGVAHRLADAFVEVEAGWNLVLYASWALDAGEADAGLIAHAAVGKAGAAAVHAAERGLQVHGGIGVTWEADPHLYIRRALASNAVVGGHAPHTRLAGAAQFATGVER